MPKKVMSVKDNNNDHTIENYRQAFTPGWDKSLKSREALPIKVNGQIVRTFRNIETIDADEKGLIDDERNAFIEERSRSRSKSKKRSLPVTTEEATKKEEIDSDSDAKSHDALNPIEDDFLDTDDEVNNYSVDGQNDDDNDDDNDVDNEMEIDNEKKRALKQDVVDGDEIDEATMMKEEARRIRKDTIEQWLISTDIVLVKSRLAQICQYIMADPRSSVKRRKLGYQTWLDMTQMQSQQSTGVDVIDYKVSDLFDFMKSERQEVAELGMLSALVVFKDICPAQRIRTDRSTDIRLKKETKRQYDFEHNLLHEYLKYVNYLDTTIRAGLGNQPKKLLKWSSAASLGLSALRCQCELLRSLPSFNFRGRLLQTVVLRGTQGSPQNRVSDLCCSSLKKIFVNDSDGEISFETVKYFAKTLDVSKYNVEKSLLECLMSVKLTTSSSQAKEVRSQLKKQRRLKRRTDRNDITETASDGVIAVEKRRMKFEADSLHEICLIYFRIIKKHIGISLLHTALQGLGRIIHLVNIETVEDLLVLLKSMIGENALNGNPLPAPAQTQCVLCALRTLSGPGKEINFDSGSFIEATRKLLIDMPSNSSSWTELLECVELCLLKRYENHETTVRSFIQLLLMRATALPEVLSASTLTFTNAILLRYPSVRRGIRALQTEVAARTMEDDVVEDLAMAPLQSSDDPLGDSAALISSDGSGAMTPMRPDSDGSWVLPLLLQGQSSIVKHRTMVVGSAAVTPLPARAEDSRVDFMAATLNRLESMWEDLPHPKSSSLSSSSSSLSSGKHQNNGKNMSINKKTLSKGKGKAKGKK